MTTNLGGLPYSLAPLAEAIHADNIRAGWWRQDAGTTVPRNVGELLALVHSEISEADDGRIGELMDDKLPHRPMEEVELGDTAIRVLDMLGYYFSAWADEGEPRPVELSRLNVWGDWVRLMHRTTTLALEGFRKGNDRMGCSALLDLLGILHWCAVAFRLDLFGAMQEKRAYNAVRSDHKLENRRAVGGKQF